MVMSALDLFFPIPKCQVFLDVTGKFLGLLVNEEAPSKRMHLA